MRALSFFSLTPPTLLVSRLPALCVCEAQSAALLASACVLTRGTRLTQLLPDKGFFLLSKNYR